MGTILNSKPMVVWVEGSDKRKLTNGLVLKLFYDKETNQWVGPDDKICLLVFKQEVDLPLDFPKDAP